MSSSTICCARSFQTNYQKDLCNPQWLHVKNMCMKEMHVRFQDLLSQKHSVKFSESLLKFRVTTCEKREKGSMDEIHVQFQNQLCQSHSVKCLKELPMIQSWACTAFWPAVVRGLQLRNQCKRKWTYRWEIWNLASTVSSFFGYLWYVRCFNAMTGWLGVILFPQKNLKMFKEKVVHFWCSFSAVLVHFWKCTKSAPKPCESAPKVHQNGALSKVHQKCTKSAPKVHHFYMGVFQDLCLHSSKIWWHSQVVKAFMRTGALM